MRVCSLWCEGFAPHTANSHLLVPRFVPLHHWRKDRGELCRGEESCVIISHDESSCMTHGEVILAVLPSFHGLSFGGAKARTGAFHFEILQSVVRRLRTTHRKLSPSDSTVCAFAPREKRPRSVGS